MFDFKIIIDFLRSRTSAEKAKISAYLLAPGLVLGLTASRVLGGGFTINPAPSLALTELKTQFLSGGVSTPREGFAVIIEPTASDFRVPLDVRPLGAWSSLDQRAAGANKDRLSLDEGGLNGRPPFLGIDRPVTVVVEGKLGKTVQVPGGTQNVDELMLRSRRSASIVSSVLLACIFAFGMSSAKGFPSVDRHKDAAA